MFDNEQSNMSCDMDADVTPQHRRYDACIYLRRRMGVNIDEDRAPSQTAPSMLIEMAGPSVRNGGQTSSMINKVQAAVDPDMVVTRLGPQAHQVEQTAPHSLVFVDAIDLDDKRFREELSLRVVIACLHEGILPMVECHEEIRHMIHALRNPMSLYSNIVGFTYSSDRIDASGALGVVAQFVTGQLIEVGEGSEYASMTTSEVEDQFVDEPMTHFAREPSCECSITESDLYRSESDVEVE